jgi:hypothetical protein
MNTNFSPLQKANTIRIRDFAVLKLKCDFLEFELPTATVAHSLQLYQMYSVIFHIIQAASLSDFLSYTAKRIFCVALSHSNSKEEKKEKKATNPAQECKVPKSI